MQRFFETNTEHIEDSLKYTHQFRMIGFCTELPSIGHGKRHCMEEFAKQELVLVVLDGSIVPAWLFFVEAVHASLQWHAVSLLTAVSSLPNRGAVAAMPLHAGPSRSALI